MDYDRAFNALKVYLTFEDNIIKNLNKIFKEHGYVKVNQELIRLLEIKSQDEYIAALELAFRLVMTDQLE